MDELNLSNGDGATSFEYKSWAFNKYGDVKNELYVTSSIDFSDAKPSQFKTNQNETIKLLNHFSSLYKSKGVKLIIIYPPYSKTMYSIDKKLIEDFDYLLRVQAKASIINKPIDSLVDDNYFYNSVNHLNSYGKLIYTDIVASLLKDQIGL